MRKSSLPDFGQQKESYAGQIFRNMKTTDVQIFKPQQASITVPLCGLSALSALHSNTDCNVVINVISWYMMSLL